MKIAWVVMKAYWKKQSKEKRQELAMRAYIMRNQRKRMRRVYMAVRSYAQ
jgi:hypothetical protein